jgi:hypothetical protein
MLGTLGNLSPYPVTYPDQQNSLSCTKKSKINDNVITLSARYNEYT